MKSSANRDEKARIKLEVFTKWILGQTGCYNSILLVEYTNYFNWGSQFCTLTSASLPDKNLNSFSLEFGE